MAQAGLTTFALTVSSKESKNLFILSSNVIFPTTMGAKLEDSSEFEVSESVVAEMKCVFLLLLRF